MSSPLSPRGFGRAVASVALVAVLILSGCVRRPPEPLRPSPYPSRPEAPLVGGLVDRPIDGGTQALVVREGATWAAAWPN